MPDPRVTRRQLVGNETHPGWWLHKIHAYGNPEAYVLVRTYYPTSIPRVPR